MGKCLPAILTTTRTIL